MEIRGVRDRGDVRGAMAAHARAWRKAYADILPASVLEDVATIPESVVEERFETIRNHPAYLVAVEDGLVLGYGYIRWSDTKPFVPEDGAGLKELYVDSERWGEGIGTALLDRGVEEIPADRERLVLETFAENDIARGFYEGHGFEAIDRGTIELAGAAYPVVIYERRL